jgi:hypothetical protein
MISQFNSKFSAPNYYLNKKDFDKTIESKEISRLRGSISKEKLEEFLNYNKTDLKKHIRYDREFFRLGFRAIASDTNERTLIFSMLPKNCGVGNSIYASIPKEYDLQSNKIVYKELTERSLFLISVFNGLALDFIARQMIQINVNKTYIMRLPVPQPTDKELKENKTYQKLIKNALLLTLYYNFTDFKELADDYAITQKQVEDITEKQADLIKIENDILVCKLYDITKAELEYMLATFKVFNKKRTAYVQTLLEKYKTER